MQLAPYVEIYVFLLTPPAGFVNEGGGRMLKAPCARMVGGMHVQEIEDESSLKQGHFAPIRRRINKIYKKILDIK